jgi:H/ACA ribonucleoprotein complex subunit 4
MQQLRRTRTGPFALEDAVTLQDLTDAIAYWKEDGDATEFRRIVQPMEALFQHLPKIVLRDSAIGAVCHGAPLALPGIAEVDSDVKAKDDVLLLSLKGEAVALAEAALDAKAIVDKSEGVAARPTRILMPKDTYPKVWKRE